MKLPTGKRALLVFTSAVAVILASCSSGAGGSGGGDQDERTLRFTNFAVEGIVGPPTHAMGESISEYSDGRLDVEYFWAGSLLPGPEVSSGIASGVADIGLMLSAYNPDVFEIGSWAGDLMSLPREHPTGVLQAGAAHAEVVLSSEEALQEFEDEGLKVLAPVVPYAHFDLLCVEPVTDLASAAGKRVRVAGEVWAQEAAAVGMEPVNLGPGEIYEGLQRGVIDCVMHHPPGYIGDGAWEIAKHYTYVPFTGGEAHLVMSSSVWDELSSEDQQAVWEAAADYFVEYERKSLDDYAEWGERAQSEQDVAFHEAGEDLVTTLTDHQSEVRANLPSTAPSSLSDPEALIAAYEEAMAKWQAMVEETGIEGVNVSDITEAFVAGGNADLATYDEAVREQIFEQHAPTE